MFISTALKIKKSSLEKLRYLFLQPQIFFGEAEFGVKVYVGGKRLYGVEIESVVEDFIWKSGLERKSRRRFFNVEILSTIYDVEGLEVKVFRRKES